MTGNDNDKPDADDPSLQGGGDHFIGLVVRVGRPKIYQNPWGVSRRFYVEFADGQKAMCSASHVDQFAKGDTLKVTGATKKGEWLSIGDKADCLIVESSDALNDEITVTVETGYVTHLKDDGQRKNYLCFEFKSQTDQLKGVKTIVIPLETVWQEGGIPKPPAYSTVTFVGTIGGDNFFVKEILGALPIQRIETIVVKISELKLHRFGADFRFKFGDDIFVGSVQTPFPASSIYNAISKTWEGFVEVNGVWFKNGTMRKEDGVWKEEIFWSLWRGKEKWETNTVKEIVEAITLYNKVEGFTDIFDLMEATPLIDYRDISERFKKLGFDIPPEEVKWFLWHQDLREDYIRLLTKLSQETFQTSNDEFYFRIAPKDQSGKRVFVLEVPKEKYSTLIFVEYDFRKQVNEIIARKRETLFLDKEFAKEMGLVASVRHDGDWETEVITQILVASTSQ